MESHGVDARVTRLVTDALLQEVRKLRKLSAIGCAEVRAMLEFEQEKAALGCDDDSSCLAEIADALGVDVLVVGSLARVGDESIFALRRNRSAVGQRERAVPGAAHARRRRGVPRGHRSCGQGAVSRSRASAGHGARGVVRDRPPTRSAAAAHVGVHLCRRPHWRARRRHRARRWAQLVSRVLYQGAVEESKTQPTRYADLQEQELIVNGLFVGTLVLLVVTVVSCATTGVMALFTDWEGAGDVDE